jgi:hypothetical protein
MGTNDPLIRLLLIGVSSVAAVTTPTGKALTILGDLKTELNKGSEIEAAFSTHLEHVCNHGRVANNFQTSRSSDNLKLHVGSKADNTAVHEFLSQVQEDCKMRTTRWMRRSEQRAGELNALTTATHHIRDSASILSQVLLNQTESPNLETEEEQMRSTRMDLQALWIAQWDAEQPLMRARDAKTSACSDLGKATASVQRLAEQLREEPKVDQQALDQNHMLAGQELVEAKNGYQTVDWKDYKAYEDLIEEVRVANESMFADESYMEKKTASLNSAKTVVLSLNTALKSAKADVVKAEADLEKMKSKKFWGKALQALNKNTGGLSTAKEDLKQSQGKLDSTETALKLARDDVKFAKLALRVSTDKVKFAKINWETKKANLRDFFEKRRTGVSTQLNKAAKRLRKAVEAFSETDRARKGEGSPLRAIQDSLKKAKQKEEAANITCLKATQNIVPLQDTYSNIEQRGIEAERKYQSTHATLKTANNGKETINTARAVLQRAKEELESAKAELRSKWAKENQTKLSFQSTAVDVSVAEANLKRAENDVMSSQKLAQLSKQAADRKLEKLQEAVDEETSCANKYKSALKSGWKKWRKVQDLRSELDASEEALQLAKANMAAAEATLKLSSKDYDTATANSKDAKQAKRDAKNDAFWAAFLPVSATDAAENKEDAKYLRRMAKHVEESAKQVKKTKQA